MEQAPLVQSTESGPNPLDQNGLCLLSLDGGGVRGLSTLYILKGLMTRLNQERHAANMAAVKPCEVFDLIGGTSTGGLIAIMLGRLEMDVDECISEYTELIKTIFDEKSRRLPISWKGMTKAQFDSSRLESAVKKVITKQGVSETGLFNDGTARGCKVFVCTTAKETTGITRLRSYSLADELDNPATICEAALATSAATTFFDPVKIGARKYVDGALGANNPVDEVEGEASNIWCPGTGDLKPLVKCFISIGTGNPGKKAIDDKMIKFLSGTLVGIATETENTADKFIARWRQHFDEKRYFRFNVQQGLQGVGLAEYQEQGIIEAATEEYLRHTEQKFRVRDCVLNLKQKEKRTENDFASKINEHVKRVLMSKTGEPKAYWFVPFTRNTRFVGRSPQLDELQAKLFVGHFQKVAIIGLGGVGKTQIALELAYRTREKLVNCSIFWVTATSIDSFEQAYLEIGGLLQIPGVADEKADVKTLVKNYLSQERAGEWLMIVDNADDVDLWFRSTGNPTQSTALINYIPRSSKGSIVCTTRDRRVAVQMAQSNVLKIVQMDEDVATEVLEKSLIHPEIADSRQTVLKLLEKLTFLPLAIVQAAAYINENEASILEYLSLFDDVEENIIALLREDFEDDGRYTESKNPAATTWLISFERIQHYDPLAAEYLSFMSCLDPTRVPRSLLPPAQPKKKVIDAIGTLSAYSFITKRPIDESVNDQSFDLHQLVYLATRSWLREKGSLTSWTEKAVARLAEIFPNRNHENKALWAAYLPHARHILASNLLDEGVEKRYTLLEKVGLCLVVDGKYDEAEEMQLRVFEWRERTLGCDHADTLESANNLAEALERLGKYGEAETLNRRALEGKENVLGKDHPSTLISMANLASTFWNQGRWKEAEELEVQVMETRKRVLGQEHPNTLTSMANLASTYRDQGRWKEAEELEVQVMETRKRVSGQEHPYTLTSMANLALTYQNQGRWKEAEELEVQTMEMRKRILGQKHPDTLTSMANLALTYQNQGRWKEAEELEMQVMETRKRVSGQEHPDTLTSMSNLATTYWDQGRWKEAEELEVQVMETRKRVSGQEHPYTLTSMANLATTYRNQERWKEAEDLQGQELEICKRVLGQDHPDTLTSMANLAMIWKGQDRTDEAMELMASCAQLRKKILGVEHPHTKWTLSELNEWEAEPSF